MKELNFSWGLLFLIAVMIVSMIFTPLNVNAKMATDEIIVKFKDGVQISKTQNGLITFSSSINDLNAKYQFINSKLIFKNKQLNPQLSNIVLLKANTNVDVNKAVEEYLNNPLVEYAQPNHRLKIMETPNDPMYNEQWSLPHVDAEEAWDIETGNSNIIIAVPDSGVDYNHPDLIDNLWFNQNEIPGDGIDNDNNGFIDDYRGWNFLAETNEILDDLGHGTHCTGTIAAVTNNSVGIAGLCWNCKVMNLYIANQNGYIWELDAADAVIYSVDNGADIISNSYSTDDYYVGQLMKDAFDYAHDNGVLTIAAAGNYNNDVKRYPASFENVMKIGASTITDVKADFSCYGDDIDVFAPGTRDVLSTSPTYPCPSWYCDPDGYSGMGGTSTSSPFIARVNASSASILPYP